MMIGAGDRLIKQRTAYMATQSGGWGDVCSSSWVEKQMALIINSSAQLWLEAEDFKKLF
jgi:hypothetical protein